MLIAFDLRDSLASFDDPEKVELIGLLAEQSLEVSNIVEDLLVAARADTDSVVLVSEPVDARAAAGCARSCGTS